MTKTLFKETKGRYTKAEITLENGRLSITGEEGRILSPAEARREALIYWESYFEEEPAEIYRMGKHFSTPKGAAKFVLETDGPYHGLDAMERDGKVYVTEGFGQIGETLAEVFPEVVPLLPWHLNYMRAGCEHQEKLGWRRKNAKTGVPCPECGYRYGTEWRKHELPPEIVAAFEAL